MSQPPVRAALPAAPDRTTRVRRAGRAVAAFYRKAYQENVTGLSGMVAYNLLLSLFPLALLALFIASRVLQSHDLEESVFRDLTRIFPRTAELASDSAAAGDYPARGVIIR